MRRTKPALPEKPRRRHRLPRVVLAGLAVLAVVAGLALMHAGVADAVFGIEYGGELVGVLADAPAAGEAVELFLAQAAAELGREVAPVGPLTVVQLPARESPPPVEPEVVVAALRERVSFLTLAWAVTVNGESVLILATREEAEAVRDGILEDARRALVERQGTEVLSVRYREDVGVRQVTTHLEGFYGADEAKRILLRGTDRVDVYVVKRSDSLWSIASAHQMSVPDLQRANPQIANANLIRPGDEINLIVPTPYVNVESAELYTFTRSIAFATRTVLDPERWPHESYVRERGVAGREQVTVEIARVNGQEVERKIVNLVRLSDPQVQVNVKGSRLYPNLGSGVLAWPVGGDGGRITSPYGWRWGSFHQGVDIAAVLGSPVLAADAGTVTDAAYRGNYGWVVGIDHGEGSLTTLYAHLTSNLQVKTGQVLAKGQVIGYVGSSGRSTGPHLHFEIRINGLLVDPLTQYPSGR
ncbi:MAG: M23 family metallopeptidase [bacterium]|nr:M23 family metallopeptidase [bacterium]